MAERAGQRVFEASVTSLSTDDLVRARRRERAVAHFQMAGRAFRLVIGLIAVMMLIGVCSTLILSPCYAGGGRCRARQSEAKTNLKALFVAQEVFRGEHDRYGTLDEIGFVARGAKPRYRYLLTRVDFEHFSALAVANAPAELAGDVWRITDDNTLENLADQCR